MRICLSISRIQLHRRIVPGCFIHLLNCVFRQAICWLCRIVPSRRIHLLNCVFRQAVRWPCRVKLRGWQARKSH